jgi:hypothetical protein
MIVAGKREATTFRLTTTARRAAFATGLFGIGLFEVGSFESESFEIGSFEIRSWTLPHF